MSCKIFQVFLTLLVYNAGLTICFNNKSETKVIARAVDELSKANAYVEEYENRKETYIFYCERSLDIKNIFLKYKCKRHLEYFSTHTDQNLLDDKTNSQLARCVENQYQINLTRLSCETEPYDYCGEVWQNVWITYHYSYSYFLLIICFFGCLTNIINCVVLTRKNMVNPINIVLAVLAVSDFLFSLGGIVSGSLVIHRKYFGDKRTYDQLFMESSLYGINYMFHTLSIYLTTLVACWKYLGIKFPLKSKQFLNIRNAKWSTLVTFIGVVLYQIVYFLFTRIEHIDGANDKTEKRDATKPFVKKEKFPDELYFVNKTKYGEMKLIQIIFTLVDKWIPCVLLTIFTIGLMMNLIQTNRYWKRITTSRALICNGDNFNETTDKINKMLLLFLLVFLVTELPIGVYLFTEALVGDGNFHIECIDPISELLADFEYLTCLTSFFIYVTMSTLFRTTLLAICKDIGVRFRFKEKYSRASTVPLELLNVTPNIS